VYIHTGFRWGECWERAHFEDIIVDRRVIVEVNTAEIGWEGLLDWINVAYNRESGRHFATQSYCLGTIKCREFIDQLRNC
jgi:hypothetical protein